MRRTYQSAIAARAHIPEPINNPPLPLKGKLNKVFQLVVTVGFMMATTHYIETWYQWAMAQQ